jgi:activator of HSP90 ATPase
MTSKAVSRRTFALGAGGLSAVLGAAGAVRAQVAAAAPPPDLGITGGHDAIHQEVVFKATPSRLYQALTDAKLFDRVVVLSGAMTTMQLGHTPTQIDPAVGGAFSLFGGYITGRHLELSPGERVIQAWRSQSWPPHIFSIARFELIAEGDGVRLKFDHTGFPTEEAVSLATGWRDHYWAPLTKLLAQG